MVKRKGLRTPYICSWDCGFKSWKVKEVVEHENKVCGNINRKE